MPYYPDLKKILGYDYSNPQVQLQKTILDLSYESYKELFREWRTFQMSDHLPLWVELDINYSYDYLTRLLESTLPKESFKEQWKEKTTRG